MADLQITIQGYKVRELRCKNDSCRRLIGYDNIRIGVFIYICQNCEYINIFYFTYRQAGKEFMEDLQKKFENNKREGVK